MHLPTPTYTPVNDADQSIPRPPDLPRPPAVVVEHRNMAVDPIWEPIISEVQDLGASDIHLADGNVFLRVTNAMRLSEAAINADYGKLIDALYECHSEALTDVVSETGACDIGITLCGRRFRVNIYRHHRGVAAALRPLPETAMSLKDNRVSPELAKTIMTAKQGLVIVSGPTGSGKSTLICSLLEAINQEQQKKIVTIEDPIEFLFTPKQCSISQREINRHCDRFAGALRSALRQNPDIIFVGEIRDAETAHVALHAAMTGHLVFSTMHTMRVHSTVETLVAMHSSGAHSEVRTKLGMSLVSIVCQRLVETVDHKRYPAREILFNCAAAASAIQQGKEHELIHIMGINAHVGMQEWSKHLNELIKMKICTPEALEGYMDRASKTRAER